MHFENGITIFYRSILLSLSVLCRQLSASGIGINGFFELIFFPLFSEVLNCKQNVFERLLYFKTFVVVVFFHSKTACNA